MTAVQIGLDVVPEAGGTTTAIRSFQEALGGRIVSFTAYEREHLAVGADVVHVPAGRGPLGRLYARPPRAALAAAEVALDGASLLVVHGVYRYHADWALRQARRRRIPYWVVPHGFLDPWVFSYRSAQKRAWMALVGRRLLEGASAVLLATAQEREKAVRYLAGARCHVLPWPVEVPPDEPAPEEARAQARARLGIAPADRVLLFLGRLHPMKRVLETVDAVGAAGRRDVVLLVAGPPGPGIGEAEVLRRGEDAGAQVAFAGAVFGAAREEVFRAADAFVSLSHRENFGYTVAEALARGLPVILSPGNDLARDLDGVDCGWLLRSADTSEAAAAVREFAQAPAAMLTGRGARGRAWVREALDPARFRRRLLDLAAAGGEA